MLKGGSGIGWLDCSFIDWHCMIDGHCMSKYSFDKVNQGSEGGEGSTVDT